ncbi:MAG: 4Fe-4S binding protein [Alphaproteobacteria bacterium]|nr:4Fe-4S binding protein [Alphaproteobacteria bacterium]
MTPLAGPRLGTTRLAVQLVAFAVLVYGGMVLGHYTAQKLSNALPALSCAFDQNDGAYCALLPLQHQMHHRVGEGAARAGALAWEMLLPTAFTLLSFFLLFVVLSKAFCGWICPLGALQEMIGRLGRRFGLPARSVGTRLRPIKWGVLGGLVLVLPLLAGLGVAPHAAGDAYCQLCPSRIAMTLVNGDVSQMAVPQDDWWSLGFAAGRNFILGFVLVAALSMRQPFCRICPMLALHALTRRLSPMRLVKRQHDGCATCGLCVRACPMDIPEVQQRHGPRAYSEDCTLCGRCVQFCPADGVLKLSFGPLPLASSDAASFRAQTRREKPDGARR